MINLLCFYFLTYVKYQPIVLFTLIILSQNWYHIGEKIFISYSYYSLFEYLFVFQQRVDSCKYWNRKVLNVFFFFLINVVLIIKQNGYPAVLKIYCESITCYGRVQAKPFLSSFCCVCYPANSKYRQKKMSLAGRIQLFIYFLVQ